LKRQLGQTCWLNTLILCCLKDFATVSLGFSRIRSGFPRCLRRLLREPQSFVFVRPPLQHELIRAWTTIVLTASAWTCRLRCAGQPLSGLHLVTLPKGFRSTSRVFRQPEHRGEGEECQKSRGESQTHP